MKLPPLNALRCFEAAARLLSLKLAASELCVTPSAVSQQIARLEETLNVPLFIRTPRRLQLTAVGEIYLRAVQPAFHQIAAATQRADSHLFWSRGHLQTLGGGGYLMKRRLNGPQVDLSHRR